MTAHDKYHAFRTNPTPANAVALARAEFVSAHPNADNEYVDALQRAEDMLRAGERAMDKLRKFFTDNSGGNGNGNGEDDT